MKYFLFTAVNSAAVNPAAVNPAAVNPAAVNPAAVNRWYTCIISMFICYQ